MHVRACTCVCTCVGASVFQWKHLDIHLEMFLRSSTIATIMPLVIRITRPVGDERPFGLKVALLIKHSLRFREETGVLHVAARRRSHVSPSRPPVCSGLGDQPCRPLNPDLPSWLTPPYRQGALDCSQKGSPSRDTRHVMHMKIECFHYVKTDGGRTGEGRRRKKNRQRR